MARHLEVGQVLVYFSFLKTMLSFYLPKVPGQVDEHCLHGLLGASTLHLNHQAEEHPEFLPKIFVR